MLGSTGDVNFSYLVVELRHESEVDDAIELVLSATNLLVNVAFLPYQHVSAALTNGREAEACAQLPT